MIETLLQTNADYVPTFLRIIAGITIFPAGWLGFVLTLLLVRLALNSRVSDPDLIAGLVGLFLIGLFHAWIGAFGRK
jgi:hypothetical protein